MNRIVTLGPAVVVASTMVGMLFAGPTIVRSIGVARAKVAMEEADLRLQDQNILAEIAAAQRDIATVVEPSVVHVSGVGSMDRRRRFAFASTGSGWIWDEDGHVVTNAHVVDGADEIEIQLNTGEVRVGRVIGLDLRSDIAVVKVPGGGLLPARKGESRDVRQGDLVYAFGSPFDFRFSMSGGIVSGLGRSAGLEQIDYENFIQVDAAINPGNSGGPLTDVYGRVVGMNTAIATGRGNSVGQGQFAGIGLAIPMSQIRNVVEQVISTGDVRKGFLGVGLMETEGPFLDRFASNFDGDSVERVRVRGVLESYEGDGVMITRVEPEFPAAGAGLRLGDVIEFVDGRRVRGMEQLRSMIASALPGDRVEIGVWRFDDQGDQPIQIAIGVVLASSDPTLTSPSMQALQRWGFAELATMTPTRAEELGVAYRRGVVVVRLAASNLTDLAKAFPPGSVIYEYGGRRVNSLDEFLARLDRGNGSFQGGQRDEQGVIVGIRPDGEVVEFQLFRR